MGTAIVKIKIMPSSPNDNLEEIKKSTEKIIQKNKGKFISSIEEPIAFGLKALIITFTIPESQELEPIEHFLSKIEKVNSVQVIDMRRAIG